MDSTARRRPSPLTTEYLEERTVPYAFGIPWPNPGQLTLSFAADGTLVDPGRASNLAAALAPAGPAAVWQREILRAFQTWAAPTNLNVGVVPEYGHPFGTDGKAYADPRFGDLRIGAYPQSPDVLAINSDYQPFLASTRSGDVLLNSNYRFAAPGQPSGYDLFTVVLNEAGNVLGLKDVNDPSSALHGSYLAPRAGISAGDAQAIQTLYGGPRKPDRYEGRAGNGTFATAAEVAFPTGYDRSAPLARVADVTTPADVDTFRFRALDATASASGVTVRLRAAGVSLLAGRLDVCDAAGKVVGSARSNGVPGSDLSVYLAAPTPDATYYAQVTADTGDVFAVGGYKLEVDYRLPEAQSAAAPVGQYQAQIDGLYTAVSNVWLGDDKGADDTTATARRLTWDPMYGEQNRYQVAASVLGIGDRDVYRFRAAKADAAAGRVLRVAATAVSGPGFSPAVTVYDTARVVVPARVVAASPTESIVEVDNPRPDADYFVEVAARVGAGPTGDYLLTAQFNEAGGNDTIQGADRLATTFGFKAQTHYERIAGVSGGTDVDLYRVRAARAGTVLTAAVRGLGDARLDPAVRVFDDQMAPVPATILRNGPGANTVQVTGVLADRDYFVRVAAARPGGGNDAGDYALVVEFGNDAVNLGTFVDDRLGGGTADDAARLDVRENQLVAFNLSAAAVDAGPETAVGMTITDAAGRAVFALNTRAGDTRTGEVFLPAGAYAVRFTAATRTGAPAPPVGYTLKGARLTDPIGPAADDPTDAPQSPDPVPVDTTVWTFGDLSWLTMNDVVSDPWVGL